MVTEKNVANLLIAADGTKTVTHSTNYALYVLNTGEPVVTTPGGILVNAAAITSAQQKFKIGVKLSTGKMQWSDIIDAKSITNISTGIATPATLQTDYIGYNGTSGAIEAINNNIYTLRLYMLPLDLAGFAQQKIKRGVFKSDSSATQGEIAAGVALNLIQSLSKEPEKTKYGTDNIKVEIVNSGTSTAYSGGSTITATKGSYYVSLAGGGADAGKYNSDGATIVAGDYIRFGHVTTKTYPVYQVESVVSGGGAVTMVVKLTTPYQGATSSALSTSDVGVIPAATALAGDFGIKLTGVKFSFDAPKFGYLLPRWKTTLQDFGSTLVTESAISAEGIGVYEQVAQMEQQFQGNEGNFYRAQVPYPTFRAEASSASHYAMICIEYRDDMTTTLGSSAASLKQLYIACTHPATGSHFTDANTGLAHTLDHYISAYSIPTSLTTSVESDIAA